MKRIVCLILMCMLLLSMLSACGKQPNDPPETTAATDPPATTEAAPKHHLLYAWTGQFSEEDLEQAIKEYQQNYTPIVFEGADDASAVSFEPGFDIEKISVARLSKVDDRKIDVEMRSYLDLHIETKCDGRKITIATDWWYDDPTSWTRQIPVWSYLVYVKDRSGEVHYYYFRVKYSAPQDNIEYID